MRPTASPASEPPGEITPEGADLAAVLNEHRLGCTLVRADEDRASDSPERLDARSLEDLCHAGQFLRLIACLCRTRQVMERQHGVRLAAAEIGLEPDHRITALAGQPSDRRGQDAREPLGRIGDPEERRWIDVLLAAFALIHQRQIRGELGIRETRLKHVRMGLADLAPRAESFQHGRLVEGQCTYLRCALTSACAKLLLV